jgi:branched-chain amino acid transport system permease protein
MAMRAFAHDPGAVALLGVPTRRLSLLTLGIAGAIAGIASFLLAVRIGGASPVIGLDLGLKGLAVMTIGGLGSIPGAMLAGVGLGVLEHYVSYAGLEGYQGAVPWLLLVAVILIRPQGLLGSVEE